MPDFRDSVFYSMYTALVHEGLNEYDVKDIVPNYEEVENEENASRLNADHANDRHTMDCNLYDCFDLDGSGS